MANEYILKDFAGGAAATSLSSAINAAATSFAVADGSSYPTGPTPFVIVVDRGLATEEKMLVGSRSTNTLTITERGYDGSTAQSHASGAVVEHCLDAHTIYQANRLANLQTTKGDLIVYSGTTTNRLAVGSNNAVFVADSAQTNGVKWATTLSGLTLTSPTVNTATISGGTVDTATVTTPTVTGGTVTASVVDQLEENWNVVASAATGTINFDLKTASIWYYTSDASADWTINVRGDGSTTLASLLNTNDSVTIVFMATNGATAYKPASAGFQIDGSAVTPKWQGGTAPSAGNASSIDVYSYTILKTAATPTYTVWASQAKFA
jgi:hypothetical protein